MGTRYERVRGHAVFAFVTALVAHGLWASSASADPNPFYGSYEDDVPIVVPPFHGLEPKLSVHYASSGGNGILGVGWALRGFSTIERGSRGHGAPTYTTSDVFYLDGQELVPCASGSLSPSCTTGGTHSTKIESYIRIAFSNNTWTATQKDGTKSTFAPVYGTGAGTFRWGLQSVTDTSGNTVGYGWWCDPGADCYPNTISYDGTTVTFYRESRPDPISFATGAGLGQTNYRVKTIDVAVSGSRARAYKLSYGVSASTSRSLLATVQQFGKDATLDSSGAVASGTSLPAVQTVTSTEPGSFATGSPAGLAGWRYWGSIANAQLLTGDFNGDGKSDVANVQSDGNDWIAWSNGNGAFATGGPPGLSGWHYWADPNNERILVGDFNGDGKSDIANIQSDGNDWIATSNGNGTFSTGGPPGLSGWRFWASTNYSQLLTGDFNADGKTDIANLQADGNNWIAWSNGNGTFSTGGPPGLSGWGYWADTNNARILVGDFNGDGKSDVANLQSDGNDWVSLSNGNGTFTTSNPAGLVGWRYWGNANNARVMIGDFNGDGSSDIVNVQSDGSDWIALSNGNGTFRTATAPGLNGWAYWGDLNHAELMAVDVNGDGRTDVVNLQSDGYDWVAISRGDGSFTTGSAAGVAGAQYWGDANNARILAGDFNGDGKTDLANVQSDGGDWIATRVGAMPDLVTSISNGVGGLTSVAYAPSSSWSNTNTPPIVQTVSSLTIADGRGNSATSTYAYAGGLWDALGRQFLGFHYAKKTMPCVSGESACPYEETWFAQDYGSVSKPQEIRRSTGTGALLTDRVMQYATNGSTVPYASVETGDWVYVYDGSGQGCAWPSTAGTGYTCAYGSRSYVGRAWDNYNPSTGTWSAGYGNVVAESSFGNYDLAGDEVTASFSYVPNPTAFITGKQAVVSTYSGIGTAGALLSQAIFYYDQATASWAPGASVTAIPAWNQAPTVGKPTQSVQWVDTTNAYVTTSATYDAYGNLTSETDRTGSTTSYTIDPTYHQYVTSVSNALGQTTSATWDPRCAERTTKTDANGQSATMTFDALCRLTYTSLPLGAFEARSYVGVGDPNNGYVEVDAPAADGSGNQWTRTYVDGRGRAWRTVRKGTSSTALTQDAAYDARGRLSQQSAPYATGETPVYESKGYDALDRPTRITHADGTALTKSYGFNGGWSAVTSNDELGHAQRDTIDAAGRIKSHDEWFATTVQTRRYAYDARGNLASVTDGAGNTWWFTIDSLGRKSASCDPDAGCWSYTYDNAGRLLSQTDALGQTTSFEYDALGRRIQKTTLAGTASASTATWIYDQPTSGHFNVGRLTGVSDPSGGQSYDYDALGRAVVASRTLGGTTYTFQYGYDAGGRPLWTTYPDGDTVGTPSSPMTYDGAGRLLSIPGVISSLTYDARGNVTTQVDANGTTTTRTYSTTRNWLTGIATTSGTTTIQNVGYVRDAEGKITTISSPFAYEGWSYGYDQHRLTSATNATSSSYSQSLTYDAIGNLTYNSAVGNYAYPAAGSARPHAATTAGATTYSYDANGNMLTGSVNIAWDGESHPVSVDGVTFAYDADGNRVQKTNGGVTTTYVSDDYEVTGGVVTKYVSVGGVLVARRVGGTTYWLHTDHHGSIQAETDATATVQVRNTYMPFGSPIRDTASVAESRGYTAQRQDETGLFYLHARYFDPVLGRFVSPDPTVPSSTTVGLNRYAYAGNDPVNHVDTDGLSWLSSGLDHVSRALKNEVRHVGHEIEREVQKTANIPVIGGLVSGALALDPLTALAWASYDEKGWARAYATASVEVAAAALTVMSAGLAAPEMVAADTAIGFGSGYTVAKINGATDAQALRAGEMGAAVSGGMAAASALYSATVGATPDAYASNPANGNTIGVKQSLAEKSAGASLGAFDEGGSASAAIYNTPVVGHEIEGVSAFHDWLGGTLGPQGMAAENCAGPAFMRTLNNVPLLGTPFNVTLMAPAAAITLAAQASNWGISALVVRDVTLTGHM